MSVSQLMNLTQRTSFFFSRCLNPATRNTPKLTQGFWTYCPQRVHSSSCSSSMCRPTNTIERRRVIIAGAGPGGLLLQALLHHRNKTSSATSRIIYETTLIESRPNLGILNQDELQAHRSWMIGLGKSPQSIY